jgi:6,7-dimethyl-8-ribityllumazine synthase
MASILKSLSDFSHVEIPSGKAYRIGIVVAQWNAEITGALYNGACSALLKNGVLEENISTVQVPGSFELTSGADILLSSKLLDAVICLGCVIQGETPHFTFICNAVANGLVNVSIKHNNHYKNPFFWELFLVDIKIKTLNFHVYPTIPNKGQHHLLHPLSMIHQMKRNKTFQ